MPTLRKHSFPFYRLGASLGLGLLLTLIAISTIHAQSAGNLDPTFNNTGIVTTTIGGDWQWGIGTALQPDGKIVVVGEYGVNNRAVNFAVLRYTVTGTLDTTFNNTGFITTAIADFASAWSVAVQPDDKIVVAGFSASEDYPDMAFALARYTPTGTLDSAFSSTGIVTTPIGNQNNPLGNSSYAHSVALQPDGKVVAAGYSGYYGGSGDYFDFAVVRYTPTGTLDSTFNHTGIVTTSIGNDARAVSAAIQPDGKIVVAGTSGAWYSDNNSVFVIARYTITGSLDSSFNHTGIVTTSIGSGNDVAFSVAVQSDGKIVAAGYSEKDNSENYNFAVARYTITGALDSTFNHTGIVTTSFAPNQQGYKMALQPDGKIVLAGYSSSADINSGNNPNGDFAVVRYTTNGALDTSFNLTGIVTTPIGSSHDEGVAVAIQPDGKIVVAGIDGEGNYVDDHDTNFAVVRYLGGELYSKGPEIVVSTESITIADSNGTVVDFGTRVVGNPITKTFTISNVGDSTLTLNSSSLTVPDGFSVVSSFGDTILAVGEETTFTIQLNATVAGAYSGEITFDNNDIDENPFNFIISGTVKTPPEIKVSENTVEIPKDVGSITFGTTTIGSPITKTFTISNLGETELILFEPITLPTGFSVSHSFGDTTLTAGKKTTFSIQLSAVSTGTFGGILAFNNNDADENPFNFVISGVVREANDDVYLPIIIK